MHTEIPKPVKREMNAIADTAHELALRKELEKLESDFAAWRRGEIDSFEVQTRIHKFHDGPAREIYNRFCDRRGSVIAELVAYTVACGLTDEAEVSPDVMPHIASALHFHREVMGRSS